MQGTDLTSLVTMATEFITASIGWITSVVTLVLGQPILLIPFFITFAGLAWGLTKRAMNVMK